MRTVRLDDVEARDLFPGYRARMVHSDRMTFSYIDVEPGASFPEHSHEHEQVVHLLEGEMELTVDGVTQRIRGSSIAVIPPNALHRGTAVTACRILDVFAPARDDYR